MMKLILNGHLKSHTTYYQKKQLIQGARMFPEDLTSSF